MTIRIHSSALDPELTLYLLAITNQQQTSSRNTPLLEEKSMNSLKTSTSRNNKKLSMTKCYPTTNLTTLTLVVKIRYSYINLLNQINKHR